MKKLLLLSLVSLIAASVAMAQDDYYESDNSAEAYIEQQEGASEEIYKDARANPAGDIPPPPYGEPQEGAIIESEPAYTPDYTENYDVPVDEYYEE
jgi:hypothetical protein